MRCFQLLTLALLATAANADTFWITFDPSFTFDSMGDPHPPVGLVGALTTDGVCNTCSISGTPLGILTRQGILSIVTTIGGNLFGPAETFALGDTFYESDPTGYSGDVTFDVPGDTLTGSLENFGSEFITFGGIPNFCPSGLTCPSGPGSYFFEGGGTVDEWGTFSVPPVPEPSSWLLLATCALPILVW